MEKPKWSYIARKRECGCIVGAYVDDPTYAKDVAGEVAQWIRDGLVVEHHESERVREMFQAEGFGCPHKSEAPEQIRMPI